MTGNPLKASLIREWGEDSRVTWIMAALLVLLSLMRQPTDLLHPGFWGEAGPSAFGPAYNHGFLATFFDPISGYQHLGLRLTTGLALLAPLALAPLVFKLTALLVQTMPALYLLARPVPGLGGGWPLRSLLAVIYLVAPNSEEIHLNVVNSQWHLTFAACVILLTGVHRRPFWRAVDLFVLAVFSLSGPYSIICAPLAVYLTWERRRKGDASPVSWAMLSIVLAGALVQAICLLQSTRLGVASAFAYLAPGDFAGIVSTHIVLYTLLGNTFTPQQLASLPAGVQLAAAVLLLAVAALVLLRERGTFLLVSLYLAATTLFSMAVLTPFDLRTLLVDPTFDVRYFFFSSVFILSTLAVFAARKGPARYPAALLLLVAAGFGLPSRFIHVPLLDTHHAEQAAVFETLPRGSRFLFQTNPIGWGMVLVKKDRARSGTPLASFKDLGKPTFTLVTGTRPEKTAAGEPTLAVDGLAVDVLSEKPAGGVFLEVDGRLYPAVTGVRIPDAARLLNSAEYEYAGFRRDIPLFDIGPGIHTLRLIALDHSRRGRFLPSDERYLMIDGDAGEPEVP